MTKAVGRGIVGVGGVDEEVGEGVDRGIK